MDFLEIGHGLNYAELGLDWLLLMVLNQAAVPLVLVLKYLTEKRVTQKRVT
jgi:hypothetical protein